MLASNLQTKKRAREENTANEQEKLEDEKPSANKKQKAKFEFLTFSIKG